MNAAFELESRPFTRTVFAACELTAADCELQATRLRSWALIRGEAITGGPFLRLSGGSTGEVHLPVAGSVNPHPEVGVSVAELAAGPAAVKRDVVFANLSETIDRLQANLPADPPPTGTVEFYPDGRDSWKTGNLAWPLGSAPGSPPVQEARTQLSALRTGMSVCDVRDFSVGKVGNVNPCCFEVRRDGGPEHLVAAAIFTASKSTVTLVCDGRVTKRYRCTTHTPT